MSTDRNAHPVIEWLTRPAAEDLTVEVAGRALPLVIRRMDRARRLTMRLSPDGSEVRVTLPRWTPTREALSFARQRSGWLARQLAALPAAVTIADGTALPYRGSSRVIRHDPSAPRRVTCSSGMLVVGGPQGALQGRLRRWLQDEAKRLFSDDLADYCSRAERSAPGLALSSAQRRWGSCAPDGTIRVNWRLVMAPDAVRRSVVAHEVAHLVHFDHSPAFHACLARLYEGDIAEANAWLKAEGRGLYRWFG